MQSRSSQLVPWSLVPHRSKVSCLDIQRLICNLEDDSMLLQYWKAPLHIHDISLIVANILWLIAYSTQLHYWSWFGFCKSLLSYWKWKMMLQLYLSGPFLVPISTWNSAKDSGKLSQYCSMFQRTQCSLCRSISHVFQGIWSMSLRIEGSFLDCDRLVLYYSKSRQFLYFLFLLAFLRFISILCNSLVRKNSCADYSKQTQCCSEWWLLTFLALPWWIAQVLSIFRSIPRPTDNFLDFYRVVQCCWLSWLYQLDSFLCLSRISIAISYNFK